jgi:preprotein translocase subunit SecB
MGNINKLESGFQIKNLILIESSFSRINNVAFGESVENNFNINIEVAVNGKLITVAEEATLVQKFQDVEQVKIKVKMVGVFECIGESLLKDFDEFGNINGAAIIFPYIREHITTLSLKAGIGAIILPPVNFTNNKE